MPVTVPAHTLEPPIATSAPTEWLTPFGIASSPTQPRVGPPRFIYRGKADEHLIDQPCYPDPDIITTDESRGVIMACGCRLVVPWWTLESANPQRSVRPAPAPDFALDL